MSTDSYSPPVAEVHSRFAVRLRDYLMDNPDAPVSGGSIEEITDGARAFIIVESNPSGSFVIEVKRDTVNPRTRDVLVQAREYARDRGADFFAVCNSKDFFLFEYDGELDVTDIDYYYLNLRERSLADCIPVMVDAVAHLDREGRVPDQSRREQLFGTLRSFHDSLWPAFQAAAGDAYTSNEGFMDTFDEWVQTHHYQDRDRSEQLEIAAKQYAYLAMSRILFSEVARRRSGSDEGETPIKPKNESSLDPLGQVGDGQEAQLLRSESRVRDSVEKITSGIDHQPIVVPHSDLFESFPHTEETRRGVLQLIQTIEGDPLTKIDEDLLGELYEELIPADERKALGQFYTHPTIAETLVHWALQPDDDHRGISETDTIPRVLDPASGSGAFVVAAYQYLAERFPDASHQTLVDHILAVDINRVPLELTALTLASQRVPEQTDHVTAYHGSFFDLDPTTDFFTDSRIDVNRDGDKGGRIGLVDAIVGNPPYIEAGDLYPDKEHFRSHLAVFGPETESPFTHGAKAIGENADAYVYFITHATQFLREGGRLGFIVPTKWMMSRYGEQFQRFLYDHYKIEAVVGFNARVFDDALIDTALVLLQKCANEDDRRTSVVEFIQLHDLVSPKDLLGAINDESASPAEGELAITNAENHRTVGIRQSYLADEVEHGKIAHYLAAPEDLIALVESPELVNLGEMADVTRGAMTGSTAFFFPDAADIDNYGIEDKFLSPALKSMRGYDTISYDPGDVNRWFIDIHQYVDEVRNRPGNRRGDVPLDEEVKQALETDGYTGVLSWIRHAESENEHYGATCQNRDVWFNFGEPSRPEILFQKLLRERLFAIYNHARAVPSNAVDCIDVHQDVNSTVLFGVLNSSISHAIMEVWGRNEAGMLQLMTYETKSLPVPDIRSMSKEEQRSIAEVVEDILERGKSELSEDHRDRLDAAVLGPLDLSTAMSVDRIQELQRFMCNRRVHSGNYRDFDERTGICAEPGTRTVSIERGGFNG